MRRTGWREIDGFELRKLNFFFSKRGLSFWFHSGNAEPQTAITSRPVRISGDADGIIDDPPRKEDQSSRLDGTATLPDELSPGCLQFLFDPCTVLTPSVLTPYLSVCFGLCINLLMQYSSSGLVLRAMTQHTEYPAGYFNLVCLYGIERYTANIQINVPCANPKL